jgi:hypothetical protein
MVPTVTAFDVTPGAVDVPVAPAIAPTELMTAEKAMAAIPDLASTPVLRFLVIASPGL